VRLRAALFDVGGTLIDAAHGDHWRPSVLRAIADEFGERWWAEQLYDADIRRRPPGDPYRMETKKWLAEWLDARGVTMTERELETLRTCFARPLPLAFTLTSGAADGLRWCKSKGLAVAAVTNTLSSGDDDVRGYWQRFDIADAIDHVVTSYSTGWEKPHPAMFDRALALCGVAASDAVMIGDSIEVDVTGAKQLGIRAIWKRSAGASKVVVAPDAVLDSLVELPPILERWMSAT